ncbi:MAG: hypothetical protein ACP5D2_02830, partial [Candidatus Nanoarchaeia archaeon]
YKLFAAQLNSKQIDIDKREHSSYKWVKFKKAIKMLTYKNQKECLKVVNRWLTKQ